jgi:hypothetical protein
VARRAPLGHAGGVPTIRVTRPQHREPARALHLLRPRSCRGWYQAGRQPSAVSHRITTWPGPDCGGGRRAGQRDRKDHEHGGARGRSRRCRLSARFPHGLLLVPGWPAARGGSGGRAGGWCGSRAAGRGGVLGYRRRRPRREEYLVQAAVLARRAPGRSVWFEKFESPVPLYAGLPGALSAVRLWDVAYTVDIVPQLCASAGRYLTRAEWARYVPPGPAYQNVCP